MTFPRVPAGDGTMGVGGGAVGRNFTTPPLFVLGHDYDARTHGGGWFRVVDGETELVSNASTGPEDHAWLAGPRLGPQAEALYQNMSKTYGGR